MTRQFETGDTLPWYRQFWPWFLILLPASVVVGGLNMLYIANRYSDDLVIDDYYKNGLAINRQLEKKQRATEQGITAQLSFKPTFVTVHLSGPAQGNDIKMLLSHPMEADRDFTVTLRKSGPGLYTGTIKEAITPRWHWILEAPLDSGWRLDGVVSETDIGRAAIH